MGCLRNRRHPICFACPRRSEKLATAKPELLYLEGTALKSTRPSGSGDLARTSPGHMNPGIALVFRPCDSVVAHEEVWARTSTPQPVGMPALEFCSHRSGDGTSTVTKRFESIAHTDRVPQVSILRPGKAQIYPVKALDL